MWNIEIAIMLTIKYFDYFVNKFLATVRSRGGGGGQDTANEVLWPTLELWLLKRFRRGWDAVENDANKN